MQFANVNLDAMKRTTDFIVGADGTAVIANTYHAINNAMQQAYNEGFQEGRAKEAEGIEERLDNAFDEGFEQGSSFQQLEDEADTEATAEECYDDGYLDAVEEAQRNTIGADNKAQVIMAKRASRYFEELDRYMNFDVAEDERVHDEA